MAESPEAVKKHVKAYMIVGGILMVLTVLTVAVSKYHFGSHAMNIFVGLVIASVKATCVAAIFMHLNHEKKLIYFFLVISAVFFAAVMALTNWHFFDIPWTSLNP
ncbi:cytochrome C oxidase subunit IV family protein [Sulfuriroseicoccus oceanibius]|uniref:Cytochrome C oxidase subunit IV family protein n=1 Tax=Sulfuriroseicoccus oceanibius TaxID=2707525 RepID=A0A6B3LCU1_9BACT|nr:cytochrome C oxidase subunit IV family protein [Sulfuriroseicoccus oceanibius]QQL44629.1 cytochrome C oxidase subunit IV family protein [Sulfuriroseicoccus oceanibius]